MDQAADAIADRRANPVLRWKRLDIEFQISNPSPCRLWPFATFRGAAAIPFGNDADIRERLAEPDV